MIQPDELRKLRLFREFSRPDLERLSRTMERKTFRPGETIIREGDRSLALYVVGSGLVTVNKSLGKGKDETKVVARLDPGAFFGEMAFLEDQPHSASVIAQEQTDVFMLPRSTVEDIMKEDPRVALNHIMTLLSGVSVNLRRTTREMVTVFEVARLIGRSSEAPALFSEVAGQLRGTMGEEVSIGCYRWNFFNDEYVLSVGLGALKEHFPSEINEKAPLLSGLDDGVISIPDLARARRRAGRIVGHPDRRGRDSERRDGLPGGPVRHPPGTRHASGTDTVRGEW